MGRPSLKDKLQQKEQGNTLTTTNQGNLPETPENKIKSYLEKYKQEFALALPRHIGIDRLLRVALTAIRQNPKLLECDVPSILGGVMQSAQLGLELNTLGQCYLVPFRNARKGKYEAQFIIGYQGLIEMFYRSGRVDTVFATAVYEKDSFDFQYGINEKLNHIPTKDADKGDIVYFYAYSRMKEGAYRFIVLSKQDIDATRKRFGKRLDSPDSPWNANYEAMGTKTAIRALAKWLPKSAEIISALSVDETVTSGVGFEPERIWETDILETPNPKADVVDTPEKEITIPAEREPGADDDEIPQQQPPLDIGEDTNEPNLI